MISAKIIFSIWMIYGIFCFIRGGFLQITFIGLYLDKTGKQMWDNLYFFSATRRKALMEQIKDDEELMTAFTKYWNFWMKASIGLILNFVILIINFMYNHNHVLH